MVDSRALDMTMADSVHTPDVPRAVRVLRWTLTVILLIYGLAKIIGPQFKYGWQDVSFHRGDPNLFEMVFYFYGYSRAYGTFIAFCEIIPAVLLHVPRFATVAAAAIFAVSLNITMMDVAFGIPLGATLVAAGLMIGSAYLLWIDRGKLLPLIAR